MDFIENENPEVLTMDERERELEKAWNDLLKEKREVDARVHVLEQQEKQFELKWDLLIKETEKLASDKKELDKAKRKLFFEQCAMNAAGDFEEQEPEINIIHGEMFFSGVYDAKSLKKRYRDLIKIYHPDSSAGDNDIVLEINREYDNLKSQMV